MICRRLLNFANACDERAVYRGHANARAAQPSGEEALGGMYGARDRRDLHDGSRSVRQAQHRRAAVRGCVLLLLLLLLLLPSSFSFSLT